jgi:hypothetical protein
MVPKVPLDTNTRADVDAVFKAEREATARQIAKARVAIRRSLDLLDKFKTLEANQSLRPSFG